MYPSKTHCRIVAVAKQTTIHSLKGNKPTKYDITKPRSPKMPVLGKGTERLKLLLSQASKEMNQPLVPMFFFIFGCTFERNRVSLSRPKLEGTVRNDGQPRGRKQRERRIIAKPQKKPSVAAFGRSGAELATGRPIAR